MAKLNALLDARSIAQSDLDADDYDSADTLGAPPAVIRGCELHP